MYEERVKNLDVGMDEQQFKARQQGLIYGISPSDYKRSLTRSYTQKKRRLEKSLERNRSIVLGQNNITKKDDSKSMITYESQIGLQSNNEKKIKIIK